MKVKRGEIYWVDWEKGKGSEQAGVRPSLIIQNDIGNEHSPNTIVASLSKAPNKPNPVIVLFTAEECGLAHGGCIDLGSIQTIAKSRLGDKCGQVDAQKMAGVDRAIKVSLGLSAS